MAPPGPRALSNLELGLSSTLRHVEGHPHDEVMPTAKEVIKGDSQKADNASVPDHLWLRVFFIGYGDAACAARHRDALNLPTGGVGLLGASEPPV